MVTFPLPTTTHKIYTSQNLCSSSHVPMPNETTFLSLSLALGQLQAISIAFKLTTVERRDNTGILERILYQRYHFPAIATMHAYVSPLSTVSSATSSANEASTVMSCLATSLIIWSRISTATHFLPDHHPACPLPHHTDDVHCRLVCIWLAGCNCNGRTCLVIFRSCGSSVGSSVGGRSSHIFILRHTS